VRVLDDLLFWWMIQKCEKDRYIGESESEREGEWKERIERKRLRI